MGTLSSLMCTVAAPYSAHPQPRCTVLTPSAAFSLVAGVVASLQTLTDVISSSGYVAILSPIAPCSNLSSVVAGSGSPSAVGSGMCSAQRGDGGLGTGFGVALARSPSELTVNGDPCPCSLHKGEEVLSRIIFRRQRSARDV